MKSVNIEARRIGDKKRNTVGYREFSKSLLSRVEYLCPESREKRTSLL